MADETEISTARRWIEVTMRLIVERRGSAYRAGWRIWGTAMRHSLESKELMWPLWLLWGALTDWVENRPVEREQAESAMRRAAQEWLTLPDDDEARRAYFDRWLYDEMGYERPNSAS